jgi:hypothetical protein
MNNLIKKYLREAVETPHFKKRLSTRLYNGKPYQTTNVPDILTSISYEKAKYYIDVLKRVDFPEKVSFAVAIGYSQLQDKFNPRNFKDANGFYYYDKNERDEEDSWGHIIWVFVENNALKTLTIHRNNEPKNRNNGKPYRKLPIEKLITYINKIKKPTSINERIDLTSKEEFDFMLSADFKPISKKEFEVSIGGKIYIINKTEGIFYPQYQPKLAQDIKSYIKAVEILIDENKASDEEVNLALELINLIS